MRKLRLLAYLSWFMVLALLTLSGCGMLLGINRQPLTLYDPHIHVAGDPAWPQVNWQLAVVKPIAARALDSQRIYVRPHSAELQVYAGVAWSQPAPDLLQAALVHAFEDSGRISTVARANTGIYTDYRLVTELRRFEVDYHTSQNQPAATVEISAKLINQRDQRIIAARTVLVSEIAANTDSSSVVAAFEIALSQAVSHLVGWTLHSGQANQRQYTTPSVFKSADR